VKKDTASRGIGRGSRRSEINLEAIISHCTTVDRGFAKISDEVLD
jgi:hypothetical protein